MLGRSAMVSPVSSGTVPVPASNPSADASTGAPLNAKMVAVPSVPVVAVLAPERSTAFGTGAWLVRSTTVTTTSRGGLGVGLSLGPGPAQLVRIAATSSATTVDRAVTRPPPRGAPGRPGPGRPSRDTAPTPRP